MASEPQTDELLQSLRVEQQLISAQLQQLNNISNSLTDTSSHATADWLLHLGVYGCYALMVATVIFMFAMGQIYPFNILDTLVSRLKLDDIQLKAIQLSEVGLLLFKLGTYAITACIVVALYFLSKALNTVLQRNATLQNTEAQIKQLIAQFQERNAAIQSLQQNHLTGLYNTSKPIKISFKLDSNHVANPGYDEEPEETE
jgi:hypothetical protein